MQSYLPFLLVHYPKVTFVDTASISPSLLEQVDVSRYNQILFAYMADSFIDSDQLSILGFPTYSLSRGAPSPTWVHLQKHIITYLSEETVAERVGFEPTALASHWFID